MRRVSTDPTAMTVRLTPAQQSALECADICDDETPVLVRTWHGGRLRFLPADANALASEITEAANSEDGQAEERRTDPETARDCRAACRALTNLAAKVRRSARATT